MFNLMLPAFPVPFNASAKRKENSPEPAPISRMFIPERIFKVSTTRSGCSIATLSGCSNLRNFRIALTSPSVSAWRGSININEINKTGQMADLLNIEIPENRPRHESCMNPVHGESKILKHGFTEINLVPGLQDIQASALFQ